MSKGRFKNGITFGQNVTWIAPDDITTATNVIIRCTIDDPPGPRVFAPDTWHFRDTILEVTQLENSEREREPFLFFSVSRSSVKISNCVTPKYLIIIKYCVPFLSAYFLRVNFFGVGCET